MCTLLQYFVQEGLMSTFSQPKIHHHQHQNFVASVSNLQHLFFLCIEQVNTSANTKNKYFF